MRIKVGPVAGQFALGPMAYVVAGTESTSHARAFFAAASSRRSRRGVPCYDRPVQLEILDIRGLAWPGYVKFALVVQLTEGAIVSGDYLVVESEGDSTFAKVTSVELFGKDLGRWSVSVDGAIDELGVGLRLLSAEAEERWTRELPASPPVLRPCTAGELAAARAAETSLHARREAERVAAVVVVPWHDEAALRTLADEPTPENLFAVLEYLALDDEARERLRRICAGITGARLEETQVLVDLEEHTLALHRPAKPGAYAGWPEAFRRLVARHEYVLFDDGVLLGSGGSFEATFPEGIEWDGATVRPRCAITVIPDWYVFEAGEEPRLWRVSHETAGVTRAVGRDAGTVFLEIVDGQETGRGTLRP